MKPQIGAWYSGLHVSTRSEEMKTRICVTAGVLLALAAPALQAADEVEPPKVHKQGGSSYVTGGGGGGAGDAVFLKTKHSSDHRDFLIASGPGDTHRRVITQT